jgi:hypothetical protein
MYYFVGRKIESDDGLVLDRTRGDAVHAIVTTEAQVRVARVARVQLARLPRAQVLYNQLLITTTNVSNDNENMKQYSRGVENDSSTVFLHIECVRLVAEHPMRTANVLGAGEYISTELACNIARFKRCNFVLQRRFATKRPRVTRDATTHDSR